MSFIELAGSEQSVASELMVRDTSVRQFATKSFNSLSAAMLKHATGKSNPAEEECNLMLLLKPHIFDKNNKHSRNAMVVLVACVPPGGNSQFEHSLAAVKFCARIRDSIIKKLAKS